MAEKPHKPKNVKTWSRAGKAANQSILAVIFLFASDE